MMIKRILTFPAVFVALFMTCGVSGLHAQNMEIGYVDPQAILSRMPDMKAVQQKMENFIQRKQEELAKKEQDFNAEVTAYQQKASVISEDARKAEEERLGKLSAELQQFQGQLQQEIQQEQQKLVAPLLQKVEDAINTVAGELNLTYVLNTTTSSGDLIILYVSDEARQKYDITDRVMREMGI